MDFITKHPNIQDVPAFLGAMAATLAQMHAEQRAHGALDGPIVGWLNDEQNGFHEEKFRSCALQGEGSAEAISQDVKIFTLRCIEWITGTLAVSNKPFHEAVYLGKGWPDEFLRLLAKGTRPEDESAVTMEALSSALQQPDSICEAKGHFVPPLQAAQPTAAETMPVIEPVSPVVRCADTFAKRPPVPVISFALPNATVGKPYYLEPGRIARAIAGKRGDNSETAQVVHLQLPENHGLLFDKITGAVSGTPTQAFEGGLSMGYVASASSGILPLQISLLINPNPASLWKELDPPSDAPYQKPLVDHVDECHGAFRVVAASRRGRSHANKGEFRDDDFAIGYASDTGWLVVAVADGAGSALYSRRGSQIVCAAAKDRLVGAFNSPQHNQAEALYLQHRDWQHPAVRNALRQMLYEAALTAHHKLKDEVDKPAEERAFNAPPVLRNYDTTLILLVIKKVAEGCVVATFAIGDGGAGLLPHVGEGFPLTQPEGGDYAGQTYFLTMSETLRNDEANLERHFGFKVTSEFCAALAMTDGITDPKFPSDSAFADPAQWAAFWTELQPALTSSPALLEWMNFFSPGNHDDRTLVAVMSAQPAAV